MSQFLAIFQIGPVQEFIGCARRTQDLWSGSYLLSYLSCVAMRRLGELQRKNPEQIIVYPALAGQKLFEYVSKGSGKPPQGAELSPSVPNRFVARLNGDEKNVRAGLSAAEEEIHKTFALIAECVEKRLNNALTTIGASTVDGSIWRRQTGRFFETYWVLQPHNGDYKASYREAAALFDARKSIRDFYPAGKEPGWKCTLCGQREPLCPKSEDDSCDRRRLQDFWNAMREAVRRDIGYAFKEGERLCAVCATKRLAPSYVFEVKHEFPSTSTVAVADFVYAAAKQLGSGEPASDPSTLLSKIETLARDAGEPFLVRAMPKSEDSFSKGDLQRFVQLEGDWFYKETYDGLAADIDAGKLGVGRDKVDKAQRALESLRASLREYQDIPEPSKYYALFRMDGDSIGKIISKCDADEHRKLSSAMGDFCQNAVTNAIEKENLGKVVYFGGDEGLALVSLRQLLPTLRDCRASFTEKLKDWKATASVGAVIAHHQQNLARVLGEAEAALKRAKELPDKDAFCVAILRRSGAPAYARAKWFYKDFDVVAYLDFLLKFYLDDKLSDVWWYQLSREEWGLKTIDEGSGKTSFGVDFARLETARLLLRHLKGHVSRGETRRLTEGIGLLLKGMRSQQQSWEEFIALTGLASFIARGGGR